MYCRGAVAAEREGDYEEIAHKGSCVFDNLYRILDFLPLPRHNVKVSRNRIYKAPTLQKTGRNEKKKGKNGENQKKKKRKKT